MDIIGNWKVAYYTDQSGKWITPEDGEDLHLYSTVICFEEGGSVLIMMPMSMEFSKGELAAMDSETLSMLGEQGLYDPDHPDMLVISRTRYKEGADGCSVCTAGEDNIFAVEGCAEWLPIDEDGDMMIAGRLKLIRAENAAQ